MQGGGVENEQEGDSCISQFSYTCRCRETVLYCCFAVFVAVDESFDEHAYYLGASSLAYLQMCRRLLIQTLIL